MYDLTKNQKKELVKNILALNEQLKNSYEEVAKQILKDEMNCLLKLLVDSNSFLADLLQLLINTEKLCLYPETEEPE